MDWFGWLPALSSGAAALAVVGAAWRYGGSVRDKRRERAAVFAWLKLEEGNPVVVVRNLGEKPVLDVTVEVPDGGMWRFGMLDAGERMTRDAAPLGIRASDSADPLALWCTDFTGNRWYRSATGGFYRWSWYGRHRLGLALSLDDKSRKLRRKLRTWKFRRESPGAATLP